MKNSKPFFLFLMATIGFCLPSLVRAGQQYITETPETTPYEHVEVIPFVFDDKIKAANVFQGPAVEMDIGLLPDVQGHLITPVVLFSPRKGSSHYGYGDLETGIKYCFIHETETMPQVGFYPIFTLPAGDARLGTGLGEATESVPLWFLKKWGSWKISGGGGYTFSQAPHTFNFPYGGILVEWEMTKKLTLGGELYAQGASLPQYGSTSLFTFGGEYKFTKNFSLLLSVGHNIAGAKTLTGYIGLDWTWGPS